MSNADSGFGLVNVLPAGPTGTHGVDLEIGFVNVDIDVLYLRQHGDGRRRGVDAARRFSIGHSLHAMHAGFEFELGKYPTAAHLSDNFLEPAFGALAYREDFRLPALLGSIPLVHAEKITDE